MPTIVSTNVQRFQIVCRYKWVTINAKHGIQVILLKKHKAARQFYIKNVMMHKKREKI